MWFKQIQLFQLTDSTRHTSQTLNAKLENFAFKSCLPSLFQSAGWVTPLEEENSPLVETVNGHLILCLQIEEKILPATVIRHELAKKIKQKETTELRKVYQKEKMSLKDELIITLLPKAFTKLTRVYAYIDTKNNWLVLGTNNKKHCEQFLLTFKKSVTENIFPFQLKKLAFIFTLWLTKKNFPPTFAIDKSCVLQDSQQQNRIIRCQHQDLFANSIQSLIKDGCEAKQLALIWHDRVSFVLAEDFSLTKIKFVDAIAETNDMEIETQKQQLHATYFIMIETFAHLLKDLLTEFVDLKEKASAVEKVEI